MGVLFSNLPSPVAKAEIDVDGKTFKMREGASAAWQAGVFLPHGPRRDQTAVSFKLQLVDHSVVSIDRCFSHWPVIAGEACKSSHLQQSVVASVLTAGVLSPSAASLLGLASPAAPVEETLNATRGAAAPSREFLATRSP